MHYARNSTYTATLDSLDFEAPEEVWIDVVTADDRSWLAAFVDPADDRTCALGYGAATPPGWNGGAIVCGPEGGG